ncbi:MAG: chemotaxis protein CheW [Treponema sp.]|nr:chemotaxis protein CheW [Treponema sp.]
MSDNKEETNVVKAAEQINEKIQNATEAATFIDFKMVTFSLAGKDYAIDIMHVKEIAKAGRFTYVPNTLPFVLGVYNLRGEIIPILDLRLFFNIDVPESNEKKLQNLLILSVEEQTFGLVVDKIDKVVGVQKSTIQPPHPLFGDINIKYINGVVESNNRLYVLLDVMKIFSAKDTVEKVESNSADASLGKEVPGNATERKSPEMIFDSEKQRKVYVKDVQDEKASVDIKFISESLKNYKKFVVSELNIDWIKRRYAEWAKERGENKIQLQSEADAEAFLAPFFSQFTGKWWSKAYVDNLTKLLPDNNAKQIVVWNPGCGRGIETYCLACVLQNRYPNAKIRIYAQDIDLLNVSNAGLLSVPADGLQQWFGRYLIQKANNEYTFNQSIKDSIMFEYHDCKNTNVLPMIDIIFARDIISYMEEANQKTMLEEFQEKLKGNGVVIIGENEAIPNSYGFGEKSVDALVAYLKD